MQTFSTSWNTIKRYARSFVNIQGDLEDKISETTKLVKIAMNAKDEKTVIALRRQRAKLFRMRPDAKEVSTKTKKYMPIWRKTMEGGSGLGIIIAATLGLAGIAAAAFVSIKGMQLLKDFKRESLIIDSLKKKTLTIAEAKGLIKSSSVFDMPSLPMPKIAAMGMMTMLPLLAIGGFLYFKMRG